MHALVIGGSNGIGLAISKNLISKGYFVQILDLREPEAGMLPEGEYSYKFCDLSDYDEELIDSYASEENIDFLMITAGFGKVADFQHFHSIEIKNIMEVNASSTIRILRAFYSRIRSEKAFYCGVMGSISGLLSSPMTSVYAASKAAICRLIESVNIELEVFGTSNRILNVSPSSFKGSRFDGGENQLELLRDFAEQIVRHVLASDVLFIPQYDEIFKGVIERYHRNPHEYGLHSYQYKIDSGRLSKKHRIEVGYYPGLFSVLTADVVKTIKEARQNGGYLIVGIERDKGLSDQPDGDSVIPSVEERMGLVRSCKYVDRVLIVPENEEEFLMRNHIARIFINREDRDGLEKYSSMVKKKNIGIVVVG